MTERETRTPTTRSAWPSFFEPDVLLPTQFFATFQRERRIERERLLMLAVLEDAVECYRRYAHARHPQARRLFEEAREWLDSADRSDLFTFETICDSLEIDADHVRRRLREWGAGEHASRRPKRPHGQIALTSPACVAHVARTRHVPVHTVTADASPQ